jgi:maltose phosphorylase
MLQCFISLKIISKEQLKNILNFMNHLRCMKVLRVHSIQAAVLDKMDMVYFFYLRTSRLDLDD